ncbi:amidohydrolase family protein [Streptomyces sp. NPDC059524]|uniref:amidohydrolase family protein n=1 Tax=Streptomyces sp. NPDC059524 TaxID=3346856 RepID=UPI0036B105FC
MAAPLPEGACDAHVHVFGPATRYPYGADRTYTPPDATPADLAALHRRLGISRTVVVQASPYGTDNSRLLDALHELGDSARGVAVITPDADPAYLDALHDAGTRGCRVNLNVQTATDIEAARQQITETAQVIADRGWHLQLHAAHHVIAALADLLTRLPTAVVLDHFAGIKSAHGPTTAEATAVTRRLLESGRVWVKLSAPYRAAATYADLDLVIDALAAACADRLLWGSDWPHTGGTPHDRDPRRVQPYLEVDDAASLTALTTRLGPKNTGRVLVENPARLYDFG